jgi:diguanylate cyclase (GGDEF)-like protein
MLKIAADRILGCLRVSDLAARIGGDEFAVLLRNPQSLADTAAVAERIVATFHDPVQVRNVAVECTVSVGVAEARTPSEYATLMGRADTAVYAAKAAGKNTWRPDRPSRQSIGNHRLDLLWSG